MSQVESAPQLESSAAQPPDRPVRDTGGSFFERYKPEQGVWVRNGTLFSVGLLIAWGAMFLRSRLMGFEIVNDAAAQFLHNALPIGLGVLVFAVAWRLVYVNRRFSDFLIATEAEMKKVNWSTRREVIGSTKVVILFTLLFALLLFIVDVFFQFFFSVIGVLKTV